MENFYLIFTCNQNKFRLFLNQSNGEFSKKFTELNKDDRFVKKFTLVILAVSKKIHNTTQYNFEEDMGRLGKVYAIKVDKHRIYTLQTTSSDGYRELYMCRYAKKESQENTKKLTDVIQTIENIKIQKVLL